jgi:hypothetical protein
MALVKSLFVLMFFSWASFAGGLDVAKEAFSKDERVQAEMEKARAQNLVVDSEISAIFFSESCGMCGCIGNYFVSVGIRPPKNVHNPESKSILARVILQNNKLWDLSLLNPNKVWENQQEVNLGDGLLRSQGLSSNEHRH